MTNAESYQQEAISKLEQNELSNYEKEFVEKIRTYTKKELRKLTSKQFYLLRKIAGSK